MTGLNRTKEGWRTIAVNDGLVIEVIGGVIYAYGSELECLRLEHAYRDDNKAKAAFSTNMNTWYFRLEPPTPGISQAEIDALNKP